MIEYLQLINTEGIGPISFHKLVKQYGSPLEALRNLPAKYEIYSRALAEKELKLANQKNVEIICFDSPKYPQRLKQIVDAPPVLYAKGNLKLLNQELMISMVGTRNASTNSRKLASRIAYDLTNNGVLIVSGMALGIDTSAHLGAMYAKKQSGETIAVLGTGVDVIYPSQNKDVYNKILENGLLISEFPLGTQPQANNFPRRNRIVSGISSGTLVVQATLNSGSLITARLANEQGRDVFAIPGYPDDARSLGTNHLIKEGAILINDYTDILQHLSLPIPKIVKQTVDNLEKNTNIAQINILEFIDHQGVYVDEIIRNSGLNASLIALELMELELSGKIERQAGNKVALIK